MQIKCFSTDIQTVRIMIVLFLYIQDNPQWSTLSEWKRSPDGAYTVKDYRSTEFEAIVKSVGTGRLTTHDNQCMITLVQHIDKEWDTIYRNYTEADCCDGAAENSLGHIPSSFQKSLIQLAWIPQKILGEGSGTQLHRGMDLFQDEPWIAKVLAHHVPYVGAKIANQNLVKLLDIKISVGSPELLNFLQEWSASSTKSGLPFCTSVSHMKNVYLHLYHQKDREALHQTETLQESFQNNAFIFVPDHSSSKVNPDTVRPGSFHTVHDVCWMDSSSVIYRKQITFNDDLPAGIPKLLQPHYHTESGDLIEHAFGYFGVSREPKLLAQVVLLQHISSISATPLLQHIEDFSDVALAITNQSENYHDFVYNNLKDARVFPTEEDRWVSLKDGLYENDNTRLAKLFGEKGIHFLKWPQQSTKGKRRPPQRSELYQSLYQRFITICKIRKLSEVIEVQVIPQGVSSPCNDIRRKLHLWIPLIQRYFATYAPIHHTWLQQHSMKEKLTMLQVLEVPRLECVYTNQHAQHPTTVVTASAGCEYIDGPPPTVYVATSSALKVTSLVTALRGLFVVKTALDSTSDAFDDSYFERFVKDLWLLVQDPSNREDEEELLAEYRLDSLADEEPLWHVPLPVDEAPLPPQEESESSSDEEDSSLTTEATEADKEQQQGLKAWPPRAPSLEAGSKSVAPATARRDPELTAARRGEEINPDNVIGRKELDLLKQKYSFLGKEEGESGPPQPTNQTPPPTMPTGSEAPPAPSDDDKEQSGFTRSAQPRIHRATHADESTSSRCDGEKEVPGAAGGQLRESEREKRALPWMERSPANLSNIETVDISSKMQRAEVEDLEMPTIPSDDEDLESRKAIGRWGEKWVYTFLLQKRKLADGRELQQVTWMNEVDESNEPYDIIVQTQDTQVYIEVKSTASSSKELVAISWKELKFAEKEGDNFHLYRVYGAGMSSPQLLWLENLYQHLETTPTRFFLEL